MNKLMNRFIYAYIFMIPIYPAISSIAIGPFPLLMLSTLIVLALSCVYSLKYPYKRRGNMLIIIAMFVSVFASILMGDSAVSCIISISYYVVPLIIVSIIKPSKIEFVQSLNVFMVSMILAAVLTILALIGVLKRTSGFYVNIYYVDAGAGILAIIIGFYYLLSHNTEFTRLKAVLLCVTGVVVVFFGQSRSRIAISVGAVMSILLLFIRYYGVKESKSLIRVFSVVLVSLVLIIISVNSIPQLSAFYENIIHRFSLTNRLDINYTSRTSEMARYVECFKENPIFGKGWGLLTSENPANMQYRAHNMYVTILGLSGLVFFIPFIIRLLDILCKYITAVFKKYNSISIMGITIFISCLLLGITSAGFGKLSGILFMLFSYMCLFIDKNGEMQK